MNNKLIVLTISLICSFYTHGVECYNYKGKGILDDITFDLSQRVSSSNNTVGTIVEQSMNFSYLVKAICPDFPGIKNSTKRSYVTNLPIVETINSYQYIKLNDYLIGAMRISDTSAGAFYPPVKYEQMGTHPHVSRQLPFDVMDHNFIFRIKVVKPFIGFVMIPKQTLFYVHVTTDNDPLVVPTYTISYSGSITVPQSCQINNNQTIDIDFGKIPSTSFSQTGAGNKPLGVNAQTREVLIKCTNIDAYAALALGIESEKSNNDILVSNNPAIGFKFSDSSGNVLRPNDPNSKIPFKNNNPSKISINVWPVSIDGSKPEPGPFRGNGYLRVDFD